MQHPRVTAITKYPLPPTFSARLPGVWINLNYNQQVVVPENAWEIFRQIMEEEEEDNALLSFTMPKKLPAVAAPEDYAAAVLGKQPLGQPRRILPLGFQIEGARQLAMRRNLVFHAPAGSGKTVMAEIAILRINARRVLWACPGHVVHQTVASIKEKLGYNVYTWLPPSQRRAGYQSVADYVARQVSLGQPCIVVFGLDNVAALSLTAGAFANPDAPDLRLSEDLCALLAVKGTSLLIIDELHLLGSHTRWRALDGNAEEVQFVPRDNRTFCFQHLSHLKEWDYRLGMTATDLPDRQRQVYAIYDLIHPRCFGARYYDFALRYCGGNKAMGWLDDRANTNTEELVRRKQLMTYRPPLDQIRAEMPRKTFTTRWVSREMQSRAALPADNPEIAAEFRRLKKASKQGGEDSLAYDLAVAALLCGRALTEDATEALEGGHHVLILVQHVAPAYGLARWLQRHHVEPFSVVHGDSDHEERGRIIKEWEAGPPSVLIGTGGSIGVGVDFRVATRLFIVELPYRPIDVIQQSGRIGRVGTTAPCEVKFYIAEGSRGERVQEILLAKLPAAQAMAGDGEIDELASAVKSADEDPAFLQGYFTSFTAEFKDDNE